MCMIILMEEYTLIKLQLYFFIFLLVKTTIILDYIFLPNQIRLLCQVQKCINIVQTGIV